MKYDISALGNALVDTQYMVDHDFLDEIGLEADSMTLASAEEQAPIIKKLIDMGSESVSDCGGSATNSLIAAHQTMAQSVIMFVEYLMMLTEKNILRAFDQQE